MFIENNILKRIDRKDVINGVFIAPDNVLYVCSFLTFKNVSTIILPNVVEIGSNFLYNNYKLTRLVIPKVEKIGNNFLAMNNSLESLDIPNIKEIGLWFMVRNTNFKYSPKIIKALSGHMYVGGVEVDKKEFIRKINLKKICL